MATNQPLLINERVLVSLAGQSRTGVYLGTSRERDGVYGKDDHAHVRFDDYADVRVVPLADCVALAEVRRRFLDLREVPVTRAQLEALHGLMQELTQRLHELPDDRADDATRLVQDQMGGLAQFLALYKRAP